MMNKGGEEVSKRRREGAEEANNKCSAMTLSLSDFSLRCESASKTSSAEKAVQEMSEEVIDV